MFSDLVTSLTHTTSFSELVADAPVPVTGELYADYWSRSRVFWCGLVNRGLQDGAEQSPSPSTPDAAVLRVAERLAEDFFDKSVH